MLYLRFHTLFIKDDSFGPGDRVKTKTDKTKIRLLIAMAFIAVLFIRATVIFFNNLNCVRFSGNPRAQGKAFLCARIFNTIHP